MTRSAVCLGLALSLTVGVAAEAAAAKAKPAPKARASRASMSDEGAPSAAGEAIEKLKGDFKWGMSPDEVIGKVQERVRSSFDEKIKQTAQDPSRQDRVRKDMMAQVDKVKDKYIKFDGQKTGYDVSIIDQEFLHSMGESMLMAKEQTATRYFFFSGERLYKMFIAFDKDILEGKAFRDFGAIMQAQYGKAKEVNIEQRTKAGVRIQLDHYVWSSKSGDMLRLVDRSEFYDVYCLVVYDGKIARQQEEVRKSRKVERRGDSLVEAVTGAPPNNLDANDNIVDQITHKQVDKPGEKRGADIVVPSVAPAAQAHAPTPAEVNHKESAPAPEGEGPKPASKKTKGSDKDKPAKPGKGELDGLAL
jgi:hypothetical protein